MARLPRRPWLFAFALGAAGCLSPTLPLPPPSKPVVEGPDQEGMVILDGYADGGSAVFALNIRTGDIRGQVADHTGHYRFAIPAVIGDELELWYQVGTTASPAIVFQIQK